MNEDQLIERLWDALKDQCASNPKEAQRLVLVTKIDIEAAVKSLFRESQKNKAA